MDRSSAQHASRRRRQTTPMFPLTQLPLDIQLLVLGKCELPSLRLLLRLSIRLRNLFLLYPDTCLLESFQQAPEATRGYFAVSWSMHNTDHDKFDAANMLTQLQSGGLVDLVCADSQALIPEGNPLQVLNDLADLYEEVETATRPCAQGLNATMDNVHNPHARVIPVELSPTEHRRFFDSLWILKLYYQLHVKFFQCGIQREFRQAFMASLLPWQIHRVVSLEVFFGKVLEERPRKLRYIVGDEDVSWEKLSGRSTYFRNYIQATGWFATWTEAIPVSFSDASRQFMAITAIPSAPWRLLSSEDEYTSHRLLTNEQLPLRSFGWLLFEFVMSNCPTHIGAQRRFFFHETGFLFWDRTRLSTWELSDPAQFQSAWNAYTRRQLPCFDSFSETATQSEMKKARSIARWTSCPIQCSFEEWSTQEQVLSSYQSER